MENSYGKFHMENSYEENLYGKSIFNRVPSHGMDIIGWGALLRGDVEGAVS